MALLSALLSTAMFAGGTYSAEATGELFAALLLGRFALVMLAYGAMLDRQDRRAPDDIEVTAKRLYQIGLILTLSFFVSLVFAVIMCPAQEPSRWITLQLEDGGIRQLDAGLLAAMLGEATIWGSYLSWLNRKKEPFFRGRRVLSLREARKAARREKRHGEPTYPFGGVELPESIAHGHMMFVAATGGGKTVSMQPLLRRALESIKPGSDRRALIYDAKRDIVSQVAGMRLACPYEILNPFDLRSVAWDLASDCTTVAVARTIPPLLAPATQRQDDGHFFDQAVHDIMSNVFIGLHRSAPNRWTLRDVLAIMCDRRRLRAFLEQHVQNSASGLLSYFEEQRTAHNVMASIRARLGRYEPIAAAWHGASRRFSIHEWARGESILVLGNDESCREPIDTVNAVLFNRIVEEVLAQSDSQKRRTWFFLDEVADAGRLAKLKTLLIKGRSKGATVVLGFQGIEGVRNVYGDHEANELVGQCGNIGVMRLAEPATSQWAADLFGDFEMDEEQISRTSGGSGKSTTTSKQRKTYRSILPSEWLSMFQMSDRQGLGGCYISPAIGAWSAVLTKSHVLRDLTRPCPVTEDFVPRPPEEQILPEWTETDDARFGIVLPPAADTPSTPAPTLHATPTSNAPAPTPTPNAPGARWLHGK